MNTPETSATPSTPESSTLLHGPLPEDVARLFTDISAIAAFWSKLADIGDNEVPPWLNQGFLLTGANKIIAGITSCGSMLQALQATVTHHADDPVASGNARIHLDLLDSSLAKVFQDLACLVHSRAHHTLNEELMTEAVHLSLGNGIEAAKRITRFSTLFPDAYLLEDGTLGPESYPDQYARDTFDRVHELDKLADEYPAHVQTAARWLPAWPVLQSRYTTPEERERFEELADRFDLGASCPPEWINQPPTSETTSNAPEATPVFETEEAIPPSTHNTSETEQDAPPSAASSTSNASEVEQSIPSQVSGLQSQVSLLPLRKGKIGRFPRTIREELNLRISDGIETTPLLAWLNAQVEVQSILCRDFASRPVTAQNLSEWRQGGYQDWVRKQETLELARDLTEQTDSLNQIMGTERFAERLTTLMSAQLLQITTPLLESTGTDINKRWLKTQEILKELARLRRANIQLLKLKILTPKEDDNSFVPTKKTKDSNLENLISSLIS